MVVKTTFLNGDLKEEIYKKQLGRFVVKGQEIKVSKLVKSPYELKQASKQWHEKIGSTMINNEIVVNDCDKCVYNKFSNGVGDSISLYVNDMLIFGIALSVIESTKKFLSSKFEMKDLGEADITLGIKITRINDEICLSQPCSIQKMLNRFGQSNYKPISTLMIFVNILKNIIELLVA